MGMSVSRRGPVRQVMRQRLYDAFERESVMPAWDAVEELRELIHIRSSARPLRQNLQAGSDPHAMKVA